MHHTVGGWSDESGQPTRCSRTGDSRSRPDNSSDGVEEGGARFALTGMTWKARP